MTSSMVMERAGMGMPGMGMGTMMQGAMGSTATMPASPQVDDGSPLQDDDDQVQRRHADHLSM